MGDGKVSQVGRRAHPYMVVGKDGGGDSEAGKVGQAHAHVAVGEGGGQAGG